MFVEVVEHGWMHSGSARVAEAVDRLRAAGERLTPGRRAVIEVLDGDGRHLSADDVAARVAEREPGVHRATVYRSLQALVDVGLVRHTHVPGGATIYHLALQRHRQADDAGVSVEPGADFQAHGHAHLQCSTCGGFTDIDTREFDDLVERVQRSTGFAIDAEHAALLGTCAQCLAKAAEG